MDLPDNRGKSTATFFAIAGTAGHLALLILAAVAASAIAGKQLWMMIRDAGWFIWLLIPGSIVGMLVLLAVGIWFARRADSWSWVPILPSSLLMLTAVAGVFYSMMTVEAAISGASIDPSQKARILAQGIAESLNLTLFGGLLAMMLACAAATVLTARALARVGKKRAGTASGVALLLGVLSLIVVTLARFAWPALGAALPIGVFPALIGIVAVTVAALSLTGPREGLDNPAGALGDSMVAALCAIAGVAMAAIAVRAQLIITAFSAVAMVSPADRQNLLSVAWAESTQASLAHLLFAAPVALAMLGPLGTRLVYLGRAFMRTGGGVVGVLVAAGLSVAVPWVQMDKLGVTLARLSDFPVPADVSLPQTTQPERLATVSGTWVWVGHDAVAAGGTEVGKAAQLDTDQGCAALTAALKDKVLYSQDVSIGVDAAAPYGRLACVAAALSEGSSPPSLGLAMATSKKEAAPARPPFDQSHPQPGVVQVGYADIARWTAPRLHVHLSPGGVLTRAGQATDGQAKKGTDPELLEWLKGRVGKAREVTFTADPSTPAGLVVAAVSLCDPKNTVRIGPAVAADRAFDLGAPPPPSSASAANAVPPVEQPPPAATLEVTGSLSADAVKRVVNQNRSKLRACYEQGLKKNPELKGKLAVEFTIAKTGRVTAAKVKDSSLNDAKVEQCIVQTFRAMSFSKPADGDVVVSYPLTFQADD